MTVDLKAWVTKAISFSCRRALVVFQEVKEIKVPSTICQTLIMLRHWPQASVSLRKIGFKHAFNSHVTQLREQCRFRRSCNGINAKWFSCGKENSIDNDIETGYSSCVLLVTHHIQSIEKKKLLKS